MIEPERLVKSADRVRDLGEVFTPVATVAAMLDLLPEAAWDVHPSKVFLEPACGDGNFLVAILARKLDHVAHELKRGRLPAGRSMEAAQFHALEALASIYAVDISIENLVGGAPGHEVGARSRLLSMFTHWNASEFPESPSSTPALIQAASWIVKHNLIVGNMLPLDADGRATGRETLPLIEYEFHPQPQSVRLLRTTLGDVLMKEEARFSPLLSLFSPKEPELFWDGRAVDLAQAEQVEGPRLGGPARNGTQGRS